MKRIFLTLILSIMLATIVWAKDEPTTQTFIVGTVTSTAANIIASDPRGKDIFIQNNDATGIVYLNLSGDATVSDTMIVLNPNEIFTAYNITNAVSAIGSIASNVNVAVYIGR